MNYLETDNLSKVYIDIPRDDPHFQPKAVLALLTLFEKGKSFTIAEAHSLFISEISERQVRRYVNILFECGLIAPLEKEFSNKNKVYKVSNLSATSAKNFTPNELLSLYVLKQFLSAINHKFISKEIQNILDKIESVLGQDSPYFLEDEIFWNQLPGIKIQEDNFVYLKDLLNAIYEKNWINLTFTSFINNEVKTRKVFPLILYTYEGLQYVYVYHPTHKKSISISLKNIKQVSIIESDELPIKFKKEEFLNSRFAVFDGELHEVRLTIKQEFNHLFEKRTWHNSQNISVNNGIIQITMKVPLKPDFTSWVLRWSMAFSEIYPQELKDLVLNNMKTIYTELSNKSI